MRSRDWPPPSPLAPILSPREESNGLNDWLKSSALAPRSVGVIRSASHVACRVVLQIWRIVNGSGRDTEGHADLDRRIDGGRRTHPYRQAGRSADANGFPAVPIAREGPAF